jgi:hypothetical protein
MYAIDDYSNFTLLNFVLFGRVFETLNQTGPWDDTEETSCMKLVSYNGKFYPNNLLVINTQDKFEVLTVVKM